MLFRLLFRLFQQFLAFLYRFFNRAHVQESLFGEVVYLTVENHSEPFDCILDAYHHARNACKLFGNGKRLRKETLHTARTVHDQFIFFRKFLHTKDGDDVLQFLVALQNLFHALCYVIMFLSHDVRVKDTGRRSQWIDSRIDTQFRNLTVEHGRCIQMAEGCCRSRVRQVIRRHIYCLYAQLSLSLSLYV